MASWYRFEPSGRTVVTIFDLDGVRARAGARATRFFQSEVEQKADAREIVSETLRRMPQVRARWPRAQWPQPYGLQAEEEEIVLPALMLGAGRSDDEVERVVRCA
jgi:hypothetical protein